MSLEICEMYRSLQGETARVGLPVVVIRLTGCNLACHWCDTPESKQAGARLPLNQILTQACQLAQTDWDNNPCHFLVTGGEPLLQEQVHPLLAGLLASGHEVLLETNGSLDVSCVDPRVIKIVDLKAPGSGMDRLNRWSNLDWLGVRDEVKVVLCDRADYEWARAMMQEHALAKRCPVLLSPAHGRLEPRELAGWMIADRLPARLQLQLHRLIWGPDCQGV